MSRGLQEFKAGVSEALHEIRWLPLLLFVAFLGVLSVETIRGKVQVPPQDIAILNALLTVLGAGVGYYSGFAVGRSQAENKSDDGSGPAERIRSGESSPETILPRRPHVAG